VVAARPRRQRRPAACAQLAVRAQAAAEETRGAGGGARTHRRRFCTPRCAHTAARSAPAAGGHASRKATKRAVSQPRDLFSLRGRATGAREDMATGAGCTPHARARAQLFESRRRRRRGAQRAPRRGGGEPRAPWLQASRRRRFRSASRYASVLTCAHKRSDRGQQESARLYLLLCVLASL
jgi:hypothetical protein